MSTTREAINELLTTMLELVDALAAAEQHEIHGCPTGHVCAHGGDVWMLLANMVDHEEEHAGQLAAARHHGSPEPRTPAQRMVGEWMEARTRFVTQLVGMSDETFNAPMKEGEWSYAEATRHLVDLQRHVLKTLAAERAERAAPGT